MDVVISDLELEQILQSLNPSSLESVGSGHWLRQMGMLEELNVQAALEAASAEEIEAVGQAEERVKTGLVERKGTLVIVVREALVLELWREKVLPRLLKEGEPQSIVQLYMILFNEANLVNLLETVLFDGEACQSLDEAALDLMDFCARHLAKMICDQEEINEVQESWSAAAEETPRQELERHERTTFFQISIKCLSIIRYLTDQLENLPLSLTSRMVNTHDVPMMLVKCLEDQPWLKRGADGTANKVFEGAQWQDLDDPDVVQKMEGQTWLALFNLLSKPISAEKYELDQYRCSQLLRLLKLLDRVGSQLPFTGDLRKWLLQLQIGATPPKRTKGHVLIEPVAAIRDQLERSYAGHYDSIAKDQAQLLLSSRPRISDEDDDNLLDSEISRLLRTFEKESVQKLLLERSTSEHASTEVAKAKKCCVVCRSKNAKSRCSRCHTERYCSRECQVRHWSKHKAKCQQLSQEPKIQEILDS